MSSEQVQKMRVVTPISGGSITAIPAYFQKQPEASDLFRIDTRLPVIDFVRVIAAAGYSVVNSRDGQLVITKNPEDFRS